MDSLHSHPKTRHRWLYALHIGFFAGLIWGIIKICEFMLKFTKVVPGFLIEPFMKHAFLITWQGFLFGLGGFIVFSMFAATIYMLCFAKWKGPWVGIGYGLLWWSILYALIGPPLKMMPAINKIDLNSLVSDLCLFILWGAFIGYSISLEYTDEQSREPHIDS